MARPRHLGGLGGLDRFKFVVDTPTGPPAVRRHACDRTARGNAMNLRSTAAAAVFALATTALLAGSAATSAVAAPASGTPYVEPRLQGLRRHLRRSRGDPRQGRLVVRLRHLRPAARGRAGRAPHPDRAVERTWSTGRTSATRSAAANMPAWAHRTPRSGRRTSATSTASTACTTSSPRRSRLTPASPTTTPSAMATAPTPAGPWTDTGAPGRRPAPRRQRRRQLHVDVRPGARSPTPTARSTSSTAPTTAASSSPS